MAFQGNAFQPNAFQPAQGACKYPVVTSVTTTDVTGASPFSVNLPTASSGDRWVMYLGIGGTQTLTVPSGWTLLTATNPAASWVLYKDSDGTETSPLSVTLSGGSDCTAFVFRIQAGTFDPDTAPSANYFADGVTSNPDPPSLTAPSSVEALWIAAVYGGCQWSDCFGQSV